MINIIPPVGSGLTTRVCPPRRFLAVPGGQGVFHTEEWRERQTPMYLPVTENLLINTANIEQLSFTAGSWFLADETGNYCGSQEGKSRDAIFPDFSGIPDFHQSKLSMKNL